ncbi:MAG: glycosyltransferase [Kiritimatiellia bacterium]
MGSYASVGPVVAALRLRVRRAARVQRHPRPRDQPAGALRDRGPKGLLRESRHHLRHARVEITGFPLRSELVAAARATPYAPRRSGRFQILVMGGSRGAVPLNEKVMQAAIHLRRVESNFHIIHLAGAQDGRRVREYYEKHRIPATVHEFVQNMAEIYSIADIAICCARERPARTLLLRHSLAAGALPPCRARSPDRQRRRP